MCVLLVEDDENIRDIFIEYLTSFGLPVLAVVDGDAAVALIDDPPRRFSVLLTDFDMPGSRNGCDVAEHMMAHHPHVHIFVITGRPDVVRRACPDGLRFDLIYKPVPPSTLCERIAHLVEH
jgi:DNA-binding NtrC family response regulator